MNVRTRTGKAALALLILTLATGAFPEASSPGKAPKTLSTLDQIAEAGKASSLDYAKAQNALAVAAVPALVKLKSSVLSTTYAYDEPAKTSVSASLPIIDQASLSASVAQDLSSSFQASLSPLEHSDTRAQALISYAKAQAASEDAGATAGSKAVKAALSWMSQKRQLETAEKTAALKKDAYEAAKAANALDPKNTTIDDLVTAMKDWSDARSALVKAQSAELSAETALYAALGASAGEVEVALLDEASLAAALDAFGASLEGKLSSGPAESYALKTASLEVESSAAKANAIWAFEPSLALNAGVKVSADGKQVSPSASATLSLSLDDLKGSDKANAEAALAVTRRALALQKSADKTAYDVAVATLQKAKINREGEKIARDLSSELAEVAAFSFKAGSYSAIENETAALALAAADDTYFQALVDEYSAWLDLVALAGK